jgi:hypothetical protein
MSNKFWKWLLAILIVIDLALVTVLACQLCAVWVLFEFIQKLA